MAGSRSWLAGWPSHRGMESGEEAQEERKSPIETQPRREDAVLKRGVPKILITSVDVTVMTSGLSRLELGDHTFITGGPCNKQAV